MQHEQLTVPAATRNTVSKRNGLLESWKKRGEQRARERERERERLNESQNEKG